MYRRPYFFQLYPMATQEEYAALACVADKAACLNLPALRRAGQWLARLAQVDDAFLRNTMAGRWLAVCRRSASLGTGVFRLYREILPAFQVTAPKGSDRLWFSCALRLGSDSRHSHTLAAIRRGVTKLRGLLPRPVRIRRSNSAH